MNRATLKLTHKLCKALRAQMEASCGPFLGGYCIEASLKLFRLLKEQGLKPKIVSGEVKITQGFGNHWWLELDNRYIDITGDQFNADFYKPFKKIPKILIRPKSACRVYTKKKTFHSVPAHLARFET